VRIELCVVLMDNLRLLIAAEATTFVLATKVAKRPSQRNPCHHTGYTPGRVRWRALASFNSSVAQQRCCL